MPGPFVYAGVALTPCSAGVTGAGGLGQPLAIAYVNNVNAGTAAAAASFAGDANHLASSDAKPFAIAPASLAIAADNQAKTIGSGDPALTYQASGFMGSDSAAVVLSGALTRDPGDAIGAYPIRQGTLGANSNYTIAFTTGTLTIGYTSCLLYDPTKSTKSGGVLSLRIQLCSATGANLSSSSVVVTAEQLVQVSTNASEEIVTSGHANPDLNFRFDAALGPGYGFNLKTTGLGTGTYNLIYRATGDPQSHVVSFQVR
jgi:hypothetical protein